MLYSSRTSEIFTRTLSSMPKMLNGLPPYSGIRLSATVTRDPRFTRRCASAEPKNPRPPVIRTFLLLNCAWLSIPMIPGFCGFHEKQVGLDYSAIRQRIQIEAGPVRYPAVCSTLQNRIAETSCGQEPRKREAIVHPVVNLSARTKPPSVQGPDRFRTNQRI